MEKTKKIVGSLLLAGLGVAGTIFGYKKFKGKDEADTISLDEDFVEENDEN